MTEPAGAPTDATVSRELHELASAVADLKEEVRRNAGPSLPRDEAAGWDDGASAASTQAWVSSLAPARPASVRIPRLPLELLFLAGAAVLAGLADLEPVEIAAVMAAAWVIVALAEWAGSRGDRMRAEVYLSSPAAPVSPPAAATADPTWFTPPVEHTLLGAPAPAEEQATGVAKLPPIDDPESTAVASLPPGADPESTAVTRLPPVDDPESTAEHRVGS